MRSLERSLHELRRDCGRARRRLSGLASQLHTLRRQTGQLVALRNEEQHYASRIEALERTLDVGRVDWHMRGVVERAEVVGYPIPYLWIPELLPDDVYQAVLDAVPVAVFIDDHPAGRRELPVPPRMAPTHAVVTWAFLTEVAHRPLSDLLLARFQPFLAAHVATRFPELPPFGEWGVEITLSEDRIVRRGLGDSSRVTDDRPWTLLSGILCLARPSDTDGCGGRLGSKVFPCRPNSALVFLGSASSYEYGSISPDAGADQERYSYEFDIGPTREGRRRLTAMLERE